MAKNLKQNRNEIIKTSLSKRKLFSILFCSAALISVMIIILCVTDDKHPVLDSITTVLSIAGMYLTVKRCIEQWLFWMIVNGLSFTMWLIIALKGGRVYSTVIMWAVYFFLAFYFYAQWRREIDIT